MKYYKILSTLALGCLLTLASCDDDEKLNLRDYPDNSPIIETDAALGEDKVINLVYDEEGVLNYSTISRTYTFKFMPSKEDINIKYEIVSKDIPADKIEISKTEETIKAGFTESTVSITLKDFSFAKFDAEEYELGVKATVTGFKVPSEPVVSKFAINKEAYLASYSIVNGKESETYFVRDYDGSKILNKEPIIYSFKLVFDKPLIKDTKIKLETKNVDEKFLNTISWTPSDLVIAAGSKESEIITWSIKDDFLLATDKNEEHDLELHITAEENSNTGSEDNVVQIYVEKRFKNIFAIDDKKAEWNDLEKKNWSITSDSEFWGEIESLIDGKGENTIYANGDNLTFIVDLAKVEPIKGLGFKNSYNYATKEIKISTSIDHVTWKEQGVETMAQANMQYLRINNPIEARYIKYEMLEKHSWSIYLNQVYIYK